MKRHNTLYRGKYTKEKNEGIFGLKHIPTFIDKEKDLADYLDVTDGSYGEYFPYDVPISGNGQFSEQNGNALVEALNSIDQCKLIVELGTATIYENSSTATILKNKPEGCDFVTIDRNDTIPWLWPRDNSGFYKKTGDTRDEEIIDNFMKERGHDKIDFLFIDGDHSVATVLKEWEIYVDKLSANGIVMFHDIACHPGP